MVQKSYAAILAIPYGNDQVFPIKQVELKLFHGRPLVIVIGNR